MAARRGFPASASSSEAQSTPVLAARAFTRFTKSQLVAGSLNWLAQVA